MDLSDKLGSPAGRSILKIQFVRDKSHRVPLGHDPFRAIYHSDGGCGKRGTVVIFIMIGDGPVVVKMIVSFWQEANGTPWIYAVKYIFVLIQ